MRSRLRTLFSDAGCDGSLHVCEIDGTGDVALDADVPVVAASVFKVPVALEFFRQAAAGELDPTERVRVDPAASLGAPAGLSIFSDEVEVSLRDLAASMLTVSDALATDVVVERVGIERVNALMRGLGFTQTVVVEDVRSMCDSLAADCGFASWATFAGRRLGEDERARVLDSMRASRQSDPTQANRTTARESTGLLRAIWRDEAASPDACRAVRALMAKQLQRERIARAFDDAAVSFAGKTGSFAGAFRNEIGVFEFPDGYRCAVAVFTRSHRLYERRRDIDDAIGAASRLAVEELRAS